MHRVCTMGTLVAALLLTGAAQAQTPTGATPAGSAGGTPGSWIEATLARHRGTAAQQRSSQGSAPAASTSTAGAGTTSTGTGTQKLSFGARLQTSLLDTLLTPLTGGVQGQGLVGLFMDLLRPLILPPSNATSGIGAVRGTGGSANTVGSIRR